MDNLKSAKIRIRLVDKKGSPVPDAGITASVEGASAESVTDIEGKANFPKTPVPSEVKIAVNITGQPLFETTLRYEKAGDDHLIHLPFTIEHKGVVCFKLVDSAGTKLKELPISIEYSDERIEDKTDEDGKLIFSDIPVGEQIRFSVKNQDGETLEKKFRFTRLEETHEIVFDASTGPQNKIRLLYGLILVFILVIGIAAWMFYSGEDSVPRGGVAQTSGMDVGACRCEDEIEELRQEIERLKTEISKLN